MKTLKIAVMAVGVLILAGCGNKAAQNGADNSEVNEVKKNDSASDAISSISDAMASGKTMKCNYVIKDEEWNESKMSAYVNGKKYMTSMAIAGNIQNMIFDGEATYSWMEGQAQGMKMTTACVEELAKNAPQGSGEDKDDPKTMPSKGNNFENALDVSCSPANNVDFSLPENVTFSDQCEMMKNLQSSMPKMPANMPSVPSGMPQL